jgi:hypothetical protein
MASIITATVASGLTQSADNSGVLQLASGTGNLVTVPSVTGTAMVSGNMPAFSAYSIINQTLSSNVVTKILFEVEEFDTNNNFASSRFTPTVAGYYQVMGHTQPNNTYCAGIVAIYKNGSLYKYGSYNQNGTGVAQPSMSCLVYCNGSTDYVEFYASFVDGQPTTATAPMTWFQGYMVRTA